MSGATLKFLPGQVLFHNKSYKNTEKISACQSLSFGKSCKNVKMKTAQHGRLYKAVQPRLYSFSSSLNDNNFELSRDSASETIIRFYSCINDKNLKQLKEYISEDCSIEDLSFTQPIQGRQEVMEFFEQLVGSMGHNVKFRIERVCHGDRLATAVNWHLEWRETQIPFTRGCSFYECSEQKGRLGIRKARVLIESPIKPGGVVLSLLKNVTFLFDEFPEATEYFLHRSYAIFQFLSRGYNIFVAPFLNRFLIGYIKVWTLTAQSLTLALKFFIQISKFLSR